MERRTWLGTIAAMFGYGVVAKPANSNQGIAKREVSSKSNNLKTIQIIGRQITNLDELFAGIDWVVEEPSKSVFCDKSKLTIAWLPPSQAVLVVKEDDDEYKIFDEDDIDMKNQDCYLCHGPMKVELFDMDGHQWIAIEPIQAEFGCTFEPFNGVPFVFDDPDYPSLVDRATFAVNKFSNAQLQNLGKRV